MSIPKIPDAPDTRHAVSTLAGAPGDALVYGVWRRGDLLAIYDNEGAAVAHANTLETAEHCTVRVDLWKVRQGFDAAGYARGQALRKLAPADAKALGLDLAELAREALDRGTRIYSGIGGPRAGKEYIGRE